MISVHTLNALLVAGPLISAAGLILACACHLQKKHAQAYLLFRIFFLLAGTVLSLFCYLRLAFNYTMMDSFSSLLPSEIRTRNFLMATGAVPFFTGIAALVGLEFRFVRFVGRILLALPIPAAITAIIFAFQSRASATLSFWIVTYFVISRLLWNAFERSYAAACLRNGKALPESGSGAA